MNDADLVTPHAACYIGDMKERQTKRKVIFCLVWMAGLGCITAILLRALGEANDYTYYVRLYGVGVLWLVFLVFVFGDNKVTRFAIVPKRFDKAILVFLLAILLVILLAQTLRMVIGLQVFPALLLGMVSAGLLNVLRDLLAERRK